MAGDFAATRLRSETRREVGGGAADLDALGGGHGVYFHGTTPLSGIIPLELPR